MKLFRYEFIWISPLISAVTWLGMLLAMFVVWEGLTAAASVIPQWSRAKELRMIRPTSVSKKWLRLTLLPSYISDVGAGKLKPLFIAGCCVTTVLLDLSFAAERWLRHTGRLARNLGTAEKILSSLSSTPSIFDIFIGLALTRLVVFAVAGTAGLILLSIFDTLRSPSLHDIFLLLFIAGYIISAIFICAEYQRLGIHYRQHRILRMSFWLKLFFILIEVGLAVVFGVTSYRKRANVAAVIEWIIALIFTFYVLTFLVDLLPAAHRQPQPSNLERQELSNIHPSSHAPSGEHMRSRGPFTNSVEYRAPAPNEQVQDPAGPPKIITAPNF